MPTTENSPKTPSARFTAVRFQNYKALRRFSLSLRPLNVLVGPNNCGKSTILGAFRILAEGLRKAGSKSPDPVRIDKTQTWGYRVPLEDLPVSTENIFTDYDETEPARVTFSLSNKNSLELVFPEVGSCILIGRVPDREIRSPSEFRKAFPVSIGFVPILGPVEHDEPLYQREAARKALLTHRASRNFRNIWYHFPDNFEDFRGQVQASWPGMDIERPKLAAPGRKPKLVMFCPEQRYPREIYWAGFGFQVWCQLLTYALRAKDRAILVIDEPDIYLHSDLQRQLLSFLRSLGPDILLATHSTEIVSEVEPASLLVVNKRYRHAQHVKNTGQLQHLFGELGSNLNPTLTQLAKTKRAVFVEGQDFITLSLFARKLGKTAVANRSDFAVVPLEGFQPKKVVDMRSGFVEALGSDVAVAVILDRDYRTDEEVSKAKAELREHALEVHVHKRKEIENYLLDVSVLQKAIHQRIKDRSSRGGVPPKDEPNAASLCDEIVDGMKSDVAGQFIARRVGERRAAHRELDFATLSSRAFEEFDAIWTDKIKRMHVAPGKLVLAALNAKLQELADISLTSVSIIDAMRIEEIPKEIVALIDLLDDFRSAY